MMKKGIVIACAILSLLACKKEESNNSEPPSTVSAISYLPAHNAVFWVYEIRRIDTINSINQVVGTDSVYTDGDTLIDGKDYFVIRHSSVLSQDEFVRDSSGYLVNHLGQIIFSPTNFTDTLYKQGSQPWGLKGIKGYMVDKDKSISAAPPLGNFTTSTYQLRYELDSSMPPPHVVYANTSYANEIGVIYYTTPGAASVANRPYYEFRLKKYIIVAI